MKINIKVKSDGLGHGQPETDINMDIDTETGMIMENTRHEHGHQKLGSQLRASFEIGYGSTDLRLNTSTEKTKLN